MVKKPEIGKEVKAEVKGYACNNDCHEYLAKKSWAADRCGWQYTPKTTGLW